MGSIQINANFGDGKTLDEFAKILGERMKYMHETSRGSIAAMAIATLKSVRAATRVAKQSGVKVEVLKDASLYCSCYRVGGKKFLCARTKGSNARYAGKERIVSAGTGLKLGNMSVFRFTDTYSRRQRSYLIFAASTAVAKQTAKKIVASRALRYAGLARRAIGFLMMKTCTVKVNDIVSPKVNAKARETTEHREVIARAKDGNGGKYALILEDNLRYATDAVKGGRPAVDLAMKKALNKVVSQINHKFKDGFLQRKKLATPFPEIVKKR